MNNLGDFYKKLIALDLDVNDNQVKIILDLLSTKEHFGFARFNDGELMGIDKVGSIVARGDQVVDESLNKALIKSIAHKQKNYYVGIPCSNCFNNYHDLAKKHITQEKEYILNAVALTNRNWQYFMKHIGDAVKNRNIMYISGNDQDINFIRKYVKLNVVKQLKFKNRNSWEVYDELVIKYNNLVKRIDHDIVFISLGPTARIFVQEMFNKYPNKTFIDIGSTFDPFTRNVWHNCHKGWLVNNMNNTKKCKICN